MNPSGLAYLGDAFYELSVRRRLMERGEAYKADMLHLAAVRYVKAASQAKAMRTLVKQGLLSDEELDVMRKARNRKPKTIPKNSDPLEYKTATAFEALLGYHYFEGRADRAEELAALAMSAIDEGSQ